MTDKTTSKLVLTIPRELKGQLIRAANLSSEHKKLVPYCVDLLRDGVALDLANKSKPDFGRFFDQEPEK